MHAEATDTYALTHILGLQVGKLTIRSAKLHRIELHSCACVVKVTSAATLAMMVSLLPVTVQSNLSVTNLTQNSGYAGHIDALAFIPNMGVHSEI